MGNLYYYEEPQPINDSELKSFPNKFIGLYMNTDSVYLNISKNKITKENYFKFKIHINYLDSLENQLVKVNGRYKFKDEDTFLETRKIGDSIEFSKKEIDTFFLFSDVQKAKRINGNLVLNDKDSIYWQSTLVHLKKNELTLKYLYSDNDLKRMDSITKIKSKKIDTITFIISPTRTEFKNFFAVKDFGYDVKYKKVLK